MEKRTPRREVLKKVSTAAAATISGSAVLSKEASAAGATISDSSWAEYEPWQEQQVNTCGSGGCVSPDSSVNVPNPVGLGFDICTKVDGGELCVSMAEDLTAQSHDCAGGKVFHTASASFTRFEYGAVSWSQDIWIGVDDTGCTWVGVDSGETACTKVGCEGTYSGRSVYDARDILDKIGQEILSLIDERVAVALGTGAVATAIVISGGGGGHLTRQEALVH